MWTWKRWSQARWSAHHGYSTFNGRITPYVQFTPQARSTRRSHDSAGNGPTTLKGELRRLYKLIHPDLLHNQPVQQVPSRVMLLTPPSLEDEWVHEDGGTPTYLALCKKFLIQSYTVRFHCSLSASETSIWTILPFLNISLPSSELLLKENRAAGILLCNATNQKSFQLLQEYLNAAKGGSNVRPYAYHFEFYIPCKANDGSLEKVSVSLPPPQARGQFHQQQEILPTTRRAIGQLFAACGLSSNFTGEDNKASLSSLFQEASEIQRQNEASHPSLQHQLSMISNALYLGRGVRVLFRVPGGAAHLGVQIQLLERIAKALDGSSGVNLGGSTIVVGDCYKLDFVGRIWLNHEDNVESWTLFIQQTDIVTASARRLAAKSRLVDEQKVAQLMGVELVFTDDALALSPEYSLFLQRVGDEAANIGPVGGGRFSELPVQVREVDAAMVQEEMGFVTVPVRIEVGKLYKFIEGNGEEALGHRKTLKLRERKLEDLRKHVRMKLRLRHLTFDRKLSPDQLISACTRLSNHAPKLSMYTEGLSLCISDENRLPTEEQGYSVHMKWDFKLEDL